MSARVLVVDDVLPNVKLLAAKLSREYFDVITAQSGPEALRLVREASPDIVLLDVMMPEMDGFEVCGRIRSDPATTHLPVVMVTALSDTANRVRGLEAGADDFLTKPVNDVALFARVRSLVRLKMIMDEWRLRETTSQQFGVLGSESSIVPAESAERARILVVEDNPITLDRVISTLKLDRNAIASATATANAFERTFDQDFDLVLISLTLARDDGLRLCSLLRSQERTRQVPILLVAGDGDLSRVAKGLELGANDYVIKPLEENELLARARILVRRKRYQDRLKANYELSLSMALTDSLTGLFNRRYLDAHLPRLAARAAEAAKPLAVVIADIDHFKAINDTFGHTAGDRVLEGVAERLCRNVRAVDLVVRLGGEEFLVVMPDADPATAAALAERLRQRIGMEPMPAGKGKDAVAVTVSVGVAIAEGVGETTESLLRRADSAMYAAKRGGRNRVVVDRYPTVPKFSFASAWDVQAVAGGA